MAENTLKGMKNDSIYRIGFEFILEGSMENAQFYFQGSLVKRFTFGLAKSLGRSVIDAG